MAILVLLAAMSLTVKALGFVAAQRTSADRRLFAVETTANLMERLTSTDFESLDSAAALKVAESLHTETHLPGAVWEAIVAAEPDSPVPAKKVSLRLGWQTRSGEADASVRLTSWVSRGKTP